MPEPIDRPLPAPLAPTRRAVLGGLGGLAGALAGCTAPPLAGAPVAAAADMVTPPPPAPREWRAAWVASVANIDWPRRPGPSAIKLREEVDAILDRSVWLGLNAIVLQVRPACDAMYASPFEPWSEYLSGRQGQAPAGDWDPLEYWVDEAHRRGLELHAWFNPYRARHPSARSPLVAGHIARRRPELVRSYGDLRWLDPGEPAAATHTLTVIEDVVRRYDIDGVHIDDYFYPYPVTGPDGRDRPFPDEPSWQRYRRLGGLLARDDWRRSNVDRLVEAIYHTVHQVKPWLRMGISPFGIGKPALRPPGIEGFSQYDRLFADVERWCEEGWLDYLAPQLYWRIDRPAQAFGPLLAYWQGRVGAGRHVWPGLFTDSVGRERNPWPADEVLAQVALLRGQPPAGGHTHFSMTVLMQDRDAVARRLRDEAYATPALIPAMPWLDASVPPAPVLQAEDGGWRIAPGVGKPVTRWAVWRRLDGAWRFETRLASETRLEGSADVVVSAVDRVGNESARTAAPPITPSGSR